MTFYRQPSKKPSPPKAANPPNDSKKQNPSVTNTTSLWVPASAANFNEQRSFLHMTYFESIFQLFLCKNDEAIKWSSIVFWLSFRLYDCFWVSSLTHEIYLMKTITPANFLECFTYVWDEGIPATASNNCQRTISFLLFCFWDNYICSRFKPSPTHCRALKVTYE